VPKSVRFTLIGFAVVVLGVAIYSIGYLAWAAIAPGRAPITNQGITEIAGIATAAPAAALALLTIALVVANFGLAESSESLATLTARQMREQWEPLVASRLQQPSERWPVSVTLTNLATGPAVDCVYVAVFKDAIGMEMWHVTQPIELLQGSAHELSLLMAHGFDHMQYEVTDTGEVDPQSGRPLRRRIRRWTRAFALDDFVAKSQPGSRQVSRVGLATPPVDVFTHEDGTHQEIGGRQEAVICTCANGHIHRTLPHLRKPVEQFQPDDPKVAWLSWYVKEARNGIPMPPEAHPARPEPEPEVISREPV